MTDTPEDLVRRLLNADPNVEKSPFTLLYEIAYAFEAMAAENKRLREAMKLIAQCLEGSKYKSNMGDYAGLYRHPVRLLRWTRQAGTLICVVVLGAYLVSEIDFGRNAAASHGEQIWRSDNGSTEPSFVPVAERAVSHYAEAVYPTAVVSGGGSDFGNCKETIGSNRCIIGLSWLERVRSGNSRGNGRKNEAVWEGERQNVNNGTIFDLVSWRLPVIRNSELHLRSNGRAEIKNEIWGGGDVRAKFLGSGVARTSDQPKGADPQNNCEHGNNAFKEGMWVGENCIPHLFNDPRRHRAESWASFFGGMIFAGLIYVVAWLVIRRTV